MKFRNEYKQLKQENNLIFSTLAECDRDTITDILNTISNSRASITMWSWCART